MRSWMLLWLRRMRQKMDPKINALLMFTQIREKLVALSRDTCIHDRRKSSLHRTVLSVPSELLVLSEHIGVLTADDQLCCFGFAHKS